MSLALTTCVTPAHVYAGHVEHVISCCPILLSLPFFPLWFCPTLPPVISNKECSRLNIKFALEIREKSTVHCDLGQTLAVHQEQGSCRPFLTVQALCSLVNHLAVCAFKRSKQTAEIVGENTLLQTPTISI